MVSTFPSKKVAPVSLSLLPLSYCSNVLPGRSVAEIEAGIDRTTLPIRERFGRPMSVGLWLPRDVIDEMTRTPDGVARFVELLASRDLPCHTLNAFPYGDFHGRRVKEQVYLPDWSREERQNYTEQCANVLAALLPAEGEGSISTLPLGFKGARQPADFMDRCIDRLLSTATRLDLLRQETGRMIRLAIEPEPLCNLETTPEALAFFERLRQAAERRKLDRLARTHLGLCYDVCHQAVEFEDVAASVREIDRAGIRINKLHISCALRLDRPAENRAGREALRRFVEPRYLHQTIGRLPDGRLVRTTDLSEEFLDSPGADNLSATEWRVHFHVPVNFEHLGPVQTTRSDLKDAVAAVARLDYAPHLEVETYTWGVMPGQDAPDLVTGMSDELIATRTLLTECIERTR